MTDVQDKPTLSFDDKNYVIEDLEDTARYIVAQLQDLKRQEAETSAKLDQIKVAAEGFTQRLKIELEDDEGEVAEGEFTQ
jgi:predicted component of type VI protein secretion system|tara:strand:+ start:1856 stop:2095 length:240 start_codon:yes stop_codon:yes gene_type:complete